MKLSLKQALVALVRDDRGGGFPIRRSAARDAGTSGRRARWQSVAPRKQSDGASEIATLNQKGGEMTPQELRAWREALGWSQERAATGLGLSLRSYAYLEAGETSAGVARPQVPRHIELATAELTRQHKSP